MLLLSAQKAARQALDTLGVQGSLEVMRHATSIVFICKEHRVVAKVVSYKRPDLVSAQQRSINVTNWLEGQGVLVPKALTDVIHTQEGAVSLWQYYPPTGIASAYQAGRKLAQIHQVLAHYPEDVPMMDLSKQRNPNNETLSSEETLLWKDYLDNAVNAWDSVRQQADFTPLHGDYHTGNLLVSNNRLIVIDWDGMRKGPKAWDGVSAGPHRAVGYSNWNDFSRGYGQNLQEFPEWSALRLVSEMSTTRWMLEQPDPTLIELGRLRLQGLTLREE